MKILSWNVNGLRAIMKKGFLDFLRDYQPDILGIQETKLQEDQIPEELKNLEYYHVYWNFAEKKGYSGTALFTRKKPLFVSKNIGVDKFDNEGRTLITEYDKFIIVNCYFPNGQKNSERLNYKLMFYDSMFQKMEEWKSTGKAVIVFGDYNTAHKEIDLKNPKANAERSGFLPIEREWIDKIINNGWIDTFRKFNRNPNQYTWWSYRFNARKNNAGWRIDYFFINREAENLLKDAFIWQDITGSDHCPLGIDVTE